MRTSNRKDYGVFSSLVSALPVFLLAVVLSGCASKEMETYIDRDITAVIARHGQPYTEFDLPDGRRAFQWKIVDTEYIPDSVEWEEENTDSGKRGEVHRSGGYASTSTCYYTFYATSYGENGWRVVGFEKPRFECE